MKKALAATLTGALAIAMSTSAFCADEVDKSATSSFIQTAVPTEEMNG